MIKKILPALLLTSILALGAFGFIFINHEMNHVSDDCLVKTINGEACPTKIVELAMNNTLVSSIFILFFASILTFFGASFLNKLLENQFFVKLDTHYSQRRLVRWLALLEHSPSA